MKEIMKGIVIGIVVAVVFGVTLGNTIFVLRKLGEHDAALNNHASWINQKIQEEQVVVEQPKKKR